ncbi:MAG: hypothetical protein ACI976_000037 [Aureispira sp.]|jgi:hypothetical protein
MKELNYYKFGFEPSELKNDTSGKYDELSSGKIYSKVDASTKDDLNKKLFFPEENNYFSSYQKLPKEIFNFYDFFAPQICGQLDGFMKSAEINSIFGFFVSEKVKKILSNFRLPDHHYAAVNVIYKGEVFNYFFLLIARDSIDIDYKSSKFIDAYDPSITIDVTKYEDVLELRKGNENSPPHYVIADIQENEIVLNEELDIYAVISRTNGFFYFSETLKNALEKERITGFEFHKSSDPLFFSNQ